MGKLIDITGQRFERLVVLERAENASDGKTQWLCQCDCGNQVVVKGNNLKSGTTKSCGCYRSDLKKKKAINEIGNKYGKLTVLERAGSNKRGRALWLCECECGNKKVFEGSQLRYGKITSCGCENSKGEAKIFNILTENDILFIPQFSYPDLFSEKGGILKFDFAVFSNRITISNLIEYQGIQHYKKTGRFTENMVAEIQKRDKLKKEYCKKYNIPLVIIPYTHYKDISLTDLLNNSSFLERNF